MEIVYLPKADDDLNYWIKTGNKQILKKIATLNEDVLQNGYTGIGHPHPLKHELTGKWARKITDEHRYIYEIEEDTAFVFSLKGHYE